jgi:hypothetical protein
MSGAEQVEYIGVTEDEQIEHAAVEPWEVARDVEVAEEGAPQNRYPGDRQGVPAEDCAVYPPETYRTAAETETPDGEPSFTETEDQPDRSAHVDVDEVEDDSADVAAGAGAGDDSGDNGGAPKDSPAEPGDEEPSEPESPRLQEILPQAIETWDGENPPAQDLLRILAEVRSTLIQTTEAQVSEDEPDEAESTLSQEGQLPTIEHMAELIRDRQEAIRSATREMVDDPDVGAEREPPDAADPVDTADESQSDEDEVDSYGQTAEVYEGTYTPPPEDPYFTKVAELDAQIDQLTGKLELSDPRSMDRLDDEELLADLLQARQAAQAELFEHIEGEGEEPEDTTADEPRNAAPELHGVSLEPADGPPETEVARVTAVIDEAMRAYEGIVGEGFSETPMGRAVRRALVNSFDNADWNVGYDYYESIVGPNPERQVPTPEQIGENLADELGIGVLAIAENMGILGPEESRAAHEHMARAAFPPDVEEEVAVAAAEANDADLESLSTATLRELAISAQREYWDVWSQDPDGEAAQRLYGRYEEVMRTYLRHFEADLDEAYRRNTGDTPS